jgi:hypothetical protein
MTELHAGLEQFRDQLRDAVARDLDRGGRRHVRRPVRGRSALRVGVPALAAAGAAALLLALLLALTGGSPAPPADAAIMRHVVAALNAPPATILHERALVTLGTATSPYELWIESNPPHAYRVAKWGHEGTGTSSGPSDPAAMLRSMVQSGQAHIDEATTYDGLPAYKLTVAGASDPFLNGTAYVSRSDYHPLEIDTTGRVEPERIVVQTYEYLPATTANLALVR